MLQNGFIAQKDYNDYYLSNYGKREERLLTNEELRYLYFLCKTAQSNRFDFILNYSVGTEDRLSIWKSPDNKWVVSCGDTACVISYIYGIFDNIYDACILLIIESVSEEDQNRIINDFNDRLKNEISDNELEKFASGYNYYDNLFYDDFCYYIKGICGIEENNNDEINQRISIRRNMTYPKSQTFNELKVQFFNNIARFLNIDISHLFDEWFYGQIDSQTYETQKMEMINPKEHQDIIIEELKKYIAPTNNKIRLLKQKGI